MVDRPRVLFVTLGELADLFGISFEMMRHYIHGFEAKGLAVLDPVTSIDWYARSRTSSTLK